MERKFTLLHITLAAITLTTSLIGCSKVNYQANEQERIDAASFKNINYLQSHFDGRDIGEHQIIDQEFSPNVYHKIYQNINKEYEIYTEKYVVKNGSDYIMYSRHDPTQTTWDENPASSEDFENIEECGITILEMYNLPIQAGATYKFDKSEKCYWAPTTSFTLFFYFQNKKLTKYRADLDAIITFSYKEFTPTPPTSTNNL